MSLKNVLTTLTAGAQASTQLPKLENHAGPPRSRPPTPITPGRAAGKYGRHDCRLPAAATPTASPSSRGIQVASKPGSSSVQNVPKLITTTSNGPHDLLIRQIVDRTRPSEPSPKLDSTPAGHTTASGQI